MNDITRRKFLMRAGAVTAGSGVVAGCTDSPAPYSLERPDVPGADAWPRQPEQWVPTTCGQCPAGCGILTRVVDSRAVKIEGNHASPINDGGIGPKGQVGVHLLYHPDRIRQPLRRDGERGSGKWKPIAWDMAIAEISDRLKQLRQQGNASHVVVLDGRPRGVMPRLWARFLEAYGSPNHVRDHCLDQGGAAQAMAAMHGVSELPAYDLGNSDFILGFGENLLESSCQMMHIVERARGKGNGLVASRGRFVQVSANRSVSAALADEWIPIRPGTHGALALAFCHVLIRDELYHHQFISDHTSGFDAWEDKQGKHRGFRELVIEAYSPAKMAAITGVPEPTIEQLARQFARHEASVAVNQLVPTTNALATAMAIHALNALVSNLEKPGGVSAYRPLPLSNWHPVKPDEAAITGAAAPRIDGGPTRSWPWDRNRIQNLPAAILSGNPYPVEALFLYASNPAYSKPEGGQWKQALQRVPLVVSFSPLPDESTSWADYVLPDHTYLEAWELVEPAPHGGPAVVGLRRPVVPPQCQTRATGDFLIALGKAIGPAVAGAFPWSSFREAQEQLLPGLMDVKDASIKPNSVAELVAAMEATGVWSAPWPDRKNEFPRLATKSGKFEFYSHAIAEQLGKAFPDAPTMRAYFKEQKMIETRPDVVCMPHWEPATYAGDVTDYPLVLLVARTVDHAEGGARIFPFLRELPSLKHGVAWEDPIEIHSDDADRFGIHDGQWVWVESTVGKWQTKVSLSEDIQPGSVRLRLGHGAWPPAPAETDLLGAGNGLVARRVDPLSGLLAFNGTRVRIRK